MIIKAPRTVLSARQQTPTSGLRRPKTIRSADKCSNAIVLDTGKKIILSKDVALFNKYGSKQLRPNGSRQLPAEINIMANMVIELNGMDNFSS